MKIKEQNNNYEHGLINYARDWRIIIWIFVILFFSLSFSAWQIYLSNKIGGGFGSSKIEDIDNSVLTIDQEKLKTSIIILETKQADFINSKNNRSKLVDPAL
jgi:hypothetical protein